VRTVAGAKPTTEVTCLANRDTTQMRADTQHDEPLRLLDSFGIGLGVSEGFDPVYSVSRCRWTRGEGCSAYLMSSASLISPSVLCRMKTGLPRHLMMTFLPSGIDPRSTSTLAMARTSADAAMLTRKSVKHVMSALFRLLALFTESFTKASSVHRASF